MTGSNHPIRRARSPRGFALLVAIVLSAVAAVITFALANLAYKSLILASDAVQSQFAFYAADSALECALLGDKGDATFPYLLSPGETRTLSCEGASITFKSSAYDSVTTLWTATANSGWFSVNTDSTGSRCARITVYKTNQNVTSIFAEGLNVACTNRSDPRALERGEKALYGN